MFIDTDVENKIFDSTLDILHVKRTRNYTVENKI